MRDLCVWEGAQGAKGREKGREPLPNNVSKMAPDFRERPVLGRIPHQYLQDGRTCSGTRRGID